MIQKKKNDATYIGKNKGKEIRKGEREQKGKDGWSYEHLHQIMVFTRVSDEETEVEREQRVSETWFKIQSVWVQMDRAMNPMPLYLTGNNYPELTFSSLGDKGKSEKYLYHLSIIQLNHS